MPHIHSSPRSLIGKPLIGNGDCVTLVRNTVTSLEGHPTSKWRPGKKVLESTDLKPGTVIATFLCGKYPQDGVTGKHAALFISYWGRPNADGTYNSILIVDQWRRKIAIGVRELRKTGRANQACSGGVYDASNSLDAMYVVE